MVGGKLRRRKSGTKEVEQASRAFGELAIITSKGKAEATKQKFSHAQATIQKGNNNE